MLATAPSWLSIVGLVCSIAVSVGVILAAVRKWFQRIVDDAVTDQTAAILTELAAHFADDASQFAKLHAAIEKGTP